jgi:hypothetical protein
MPLVSEKPTSYPGAMKIGITVLQDESNSRIKQAVMEHEMGEIGILSKQEFHITAKECYKLLVLFQSPFPLLWL